MPTKRCIFHLPFMPDPVHRPSSTNIRPGKMLQAFRDAGYDVFVIMGDSKERAPLIEEVKNSINRGVLYDFVYSESDTSPSALTDADHFPRHPWLDFEFLAFCRRKGIPVGLFYRDAYWRSSDYAKNRKSWKEKIANIFYRFDLFQYERCVDILFVPSEDFVRLLGDNLRSTPKIPLPSGCEEGVLVEDVGHREIAPAKDIRLIYAGGITVGEANDISSLIQAANMVSGVELTICVRDYDWERVQDHYASYLTPSIRVLHERGEGLQRLYAQSDIGMMIYHPTPYGRLCMPGKLFSYLGAGLPIVANEHSVAGDFVSKNGIGWVSDCSLDALKALFEHLVVNREEVEKKRAACASALTANSWTARANKVADALNRVKTDHES